VGSEGVTQRVWTDIRADLDRSLDVLLDQPPDRSGCELGAEVIEKERVKVPAGFR
jgi:hypothetical protein